MNRAEYILVVGLLLGILSKVSTAGVAFVFGLLSVVAVAYALLAEGLTWWKNRQDAKQPPFALQTQLFFQSDEERAQFADRMKTLIQDMRREQDATNGLSAEQLDKMKAEQDSGQLSEEGKRYYEGVEAEAKQTEAAPETETTPEPQDEPTQEDGPYDEAKLVEKKYRKPQAKKGVAQKEVKRRYKTEKQGVEQISTEMGYTDQTTVYRYLKAMGIKLRPKAKQ